MNNPKIPYRPPYYDWKSVRRFIPVIRLLVETHQRVGVANVQFNPLTLNLSVETAIARLRDAVKSLCLELTIDDSIDIEVLRQIWPLFKVTSDGTRVTIVPRKLKETEPEPARGQNVLATIRTDDVEFLEDLKALARCLSKRFSLGQVDII